MLQRDSCEVDQAIAAIIMLLEEGVNILQPRGWVEMGNCLVCDKAERLKIGTCLFCVSSPELDVF